MALQKSNGYIVQSNRLIEAHYRLTLQEKRLVLWLIQSIGKDDTDFKKYQLKITDFAEMLELNPKTQYKEMRRITKALINRSIEIEDKENNVITQMAWLCFARWEPKKGICSLQFHPELKPYLLQLKGHFTKIGFADLLNLKSVYSVRIFELLVQYEYYGKRNISIYYLRSCLGIQKGEYPFYANFKQRIIDKAKYEINNKTEYEIDYTEIKESRKVVGIDWTIKKKAHFEKYQTEKASSITKELRSKNAIIEQLIEYGFSKQASTRILKNNQESDIANAIKAVDIQVQKGTVKNAKAMLATAIKEKWHPDRYMEKKIKRSC
jgi:plasmid replication initiation protein